MTICYVKGIAHPKTNETNESIDLDFRPAEMIHAVERWKKAPVLLEHARDLGVIGEVRRLEHTPGGPLIAHLLIDDSTPTGKETIEGIRDGVYRSLSIGMKVNNDIYKIGACTNIKPVELSICNKPGRPGSDFLEVSFGERKMYEIIRGEDGSQFLREKTPTLVFTNLLKEKKMESDNKTDPSVLANSRIENNSATTSTQVNASGRAEPLESVKKRLRLNDEGVALLLQHWEMNNKKMREQNISALEKDWHAPRSELETLPDDALEVCVNANHGIQEAKSKLLATQQSLSSKVEDLSSKLSTIEKENAELRQKLSAQKDMALGSADERFLNVNASAGAVRQETQQVGSAAVGEVPSSTTDEDVNASAGWEPAGVVLRRQPASIFDRPARNIKPYDYATVLKKAQNFGRNEYTDPKLIM